MVLKSSRSLIQNLGGFLLTCFWFTTRITPTCGLNISTVRGIHQGPANDERAPYQPTTRSLLDAMEVLLAHGVPRENLCTTHILPVVRDASSDPSPPFPLPRCSLSSTQQSLADPKLFPPPMMNEHVSPSSPPTTISITPASISPQSWIRSRRQRYLSTSTATATNDTKESTTDNEGDTKEEKDDLFYIVHALGAMLCVGVAALAAGLTMGLLSLDPLLLLIKCRAGSTQQEQNQAAALLPIVKQHHLLLVTLLLLNSIANEALPLFLEVLVSPLVAVIISVTLVLFFGEIIPSAIFTGPNKVAIAAQLIPVVRMVMIILWPIAFPIAKLLDQVLAHDEDEVDMFARGELSALVRIQYEERMAQKQRRKQEKTKLRQTSQRALSNEDIHLVDDVGSLDFASLQLIKASKKTVERRYQNELAQSTTPQSGSEQQHGSSRHISDCHLENEDGDDDDDNSLIAQGTTSRSESIHVNEVSMVEGALSMKTKMALDVYTPLHRMIAIPHDMILTEQNMVDIYTTGFSRIPVFIPNPQKPKSITAICGVLMTKQLIVVNPKENRPLTTLPLSSPQCVSPKMNLVDLINLFQTGKLGHLALVCARPEVGHIALYQGKALPEEAGLMGIITLEDVLEALLQEQIYDESDKVEQEANRVAQWAMTKWTSRGKKRARAKTGSDGTEGRPPPMSRKWSMGRVVEQANMESNETTRLLRNDSTVQSKGSVNHRRHHRFLQFWYGQNTQG